MWFHKITMGGQACEMRVNGGFRQTATLKADTTPPINSCQADPLGLAMLRRSLESHSVGLAISAGLEARF